MKGLHDESLSGEWSGCRSSRLSLKYRVLYRYVAEERLFEVVSITVSLGIERAEVLARALQYHPAILVFPGWDVRKELTPVS